MSEDYLIDEDMEELMAKQQSLAQRIDEEGIATFNSLLPRTDALSVTFNKQSDNDFGIDGELQILANKKNTGEKYKVQLKSSESVKYIKAGKLISFSLDVRSAYSLIKIEKVPTALVIVDVKASRAFWSAIQIDDTVKMSLKNILEKKNAYAKKKKLDASAKKKMLYETGITVHISVEQEITPKSFEPLREDLKQSALSIAKREIVATREKSLVTGMKHLSEINKQILELEGFDIIHRTTSLPASPRSIMSIGLDDKVTADLIPNKDYRPSLAPVITLNASFDKKNEDEAELATTFSRFLSGQEKEITLKGKNIRSFIAMSGTTLIDSLAGEDGITLTISPYIEKRKQKMVVSNGIDDMIIDVEAWHQDGVMHIEGDSKEAVFIKLEMVPKGDTEGSDGSVELTVTFQIRIENKNFKNTSHQLRILGFFRQSSKISVGFIGPDGFRNKLIDGYDTGGAINVPDDIYNFTIMLTEIELKLGQQIKYPLPEVITNGMAREIENAHAVLHSGWNTEKSILKVELDEERLKILNNIETPYVRFSFGEAKFTIFNQQYLLKGYEKIIQGKVQSVEEISELHYTHKISLESSTILTIPLEEALTK